MMADNRSDLVNSELNTFLDKPFKSFGVLKGRNSDMQNIITLLETFNNIKDPYFTGSLIRVAYNSFIKVSLSVDELYLSSFSHSQNPYRMFRFPLIEGVIFTSYAGSIEYLHCVSFLQK